MIMKVKLAEWAEKPVRAHDDDAGMDLLSPIDCNVLPFNRAKIDTGVHVAIPQGYVGLLTAKSGLMANSGLTSRGTIDSGYTGSISVVLFNHSDKIYHVKKGDKISQLLLIPIEIPMLEYVDELPETDRGTGGFGSTGR